MKITELPAAAGMALIRGYQKFVSPLFAGRCKYYPTCSAYGLRAIKVHGLIKGSLLTGWRILRCNPYSNGGVDHVPLPGEWKNPWTTPGSITEETYEIAARNRRAHAAVAQNEKSEA